MNKHIIFIGGFLGAGKTTLMGEAAKRLAARGQRVGLITNDQAAELVDTVFLQKTGSAVTEVSGSCFCCNFPGMVGAIESLAAKSANVILAEPVGSCTDLSATIIQPLKDKKGGDVSLAPLSVLVAPERLCDILDGNSAGLHDSSAYIFRKQLEEADFILLSKVDTLDIAQVSDLTTRLAAAYPKAKVFAVSSKNGAGLDAWLEAVTTQTAISGGHILGEVDYDIYAEGEAVLGWLNATYVLTSEQPTDWKAFAGNLLDALSKEFDAMGAAVGHVKLAVTSCCGSLVTANLVGTRDTLEVHGEGSMGTGAQLTLNARAQMSPEQLETIVREQMAKVCGSTVKAQVAALRCLSPGYPTPTYRYDKVVG